MGEFWASFGVAVVGVDLWFKGGIVGRARVELGLGSIVGTRRDKRISALHFISCHPLYILQPNIRASPITAVNPEYYLYIASIVPFTVGFSTKSFFQLNPLVRI